jgi:hypothetical protein
MNGQRNRAVDLALALFASCARERISYVRIGLMFDEIRKFQDSIGFDRFDIILFFLVFWNLDHPLVGGSRGLEILDR